MARATKGKEAEEARQMTSDLFSKRHGYRQTHDSQIKVQHDAPDELRGVIVDLAYECGMRPSTLRTIVCRALRKRPDKNNWSERPNIDQEVRELVDDCDWFRVYDAIEAISHHMHEDPVSFEPERFDQELNDYFAENGIGWQIVQGGVEMRGSEAFERTVRAAEEQLHDIGLDTAEVELHEAIGDLSRRPDPDITGAVQHAMAALECVAREACGDAKATLGDIMKRYQSLVPRPLDEAISKVWGYASENARHIREGRKVTFDEAELIVGLSATIATYLAKKT
jgi:hypothetical protein